MAIVSTLILLSFVIVLFKFFISKRYSFWKSLNIPYIEPVFPFGNLRSVGKKFHLMNILQTFYSEHKGKSPLIGLFFYIRPVALLIDLDLIKNILIKDFKNFHDRGAYFNEKHDPLSGNLFTIHGPKWKLLRTKLTPTFTSGKMKYMFPTVVEVGDRLQQKLEDLVKNGKEVEIKDVLARYTTDVIGTCAFGIECNTLNKQNADFRRMGLRVFEKPRHGFSFTILLSSIREWAQMIGIKSFRTDVTKFFANVVTETINYRHENDINRNDFLDILIELKKGGIPDTDAITLNEILAQAFIFFLAGFETSSTLLTFCLYEMSLNEDIQNKARKHIEEVLKKYGGNLSYEAMLEMKYLDQILNETLRMYSPLSTLFRIAENDYQIPDSNYVIKGGTMIAIPAFAIHKDPIIYPNPEVFNPENFSEESIKSRPSVTFLSFGEGPRNCIGLRFGMMQARIGLIAALSTFHYTLSDKMEYPVKLSKNSFITSPEGGMWLNVKQIKN